MRGISEILKCDGGRGARGEPEGYFAHEILQRSSQMYKNVLLKQIMYFQLIFHFG